MLKCGGIKQTAQWHKKPTILILQEGAKEVLSIDYLNGTSLIPSILEHKLSYIILTNGSVNEGP